LDEEKHRRRALHAIGVPDFWSYLSARDLAVQRRSDGARIFQLNVGLYCNQACVHCHVESSPKRTEMMSQQVAEQCIHLLANAPNITTLDLTGGAPELHPTFRYLVREGRRLGKEVIDRCNLTVVQEPGQEDLIDFLAGNKVRVVASLPCYGPKNVNMQRGSGVFDKSIAALLALNRRGYATEPDLVLDLVYNPIGAFLPPDQEKLQDQYKKELREAFGIEFNSLLTITNMPIKRFADFLYRRGELQQYMELLVRNFNPATVGGVMCTDTISVRWDGRIFDCDFNQQLGLDPMDPDAVSTISSSSPNSTAAADDLQTQHRTKAISVFDLQSLSSLQRVPIATSSHCFGCTAGRGSSCQGATA